MEEYLNNLIKQYSMAEGITKIDTQSRKFNNEFFDWINSRQSIAKKYVHFLDNMGLNFKEENCAEIGKGEFDTIVKPFNTTLITPAIIMEAIDSNRIINGNMNVYEATPFLVRHVNGETQLKEISSDIIDTYMTQNPFTLKKISGWENLHNSRKYDIIVGIYGSTYDKDIKTKIKELKALRDKLSYEDFKEDYVISNDNYFYVIGSSRRIKEPTKIKTRCKNV